MLSLNNLHDPQRYVVQIEKMCNHLKDKFGWRALYSQKQNQVSLSNFRFDRCALSNALAESVRCEQYQLSPFKMRVFTTKNHKQRLLYGMSLTDKIVVATITSLLTDLFKSFLSPYVYSYQKGISAKHQILSFTQYMKKQKKIKEVNGFYVIQVDIANYSEETNVQNHSPLWDILKNYFHQLKIKPTDYQWKLIQSVIRPAYIGLDGSLCSNLVGIPTGTPIVSLIHNIFIGELDQQLTQIPDLFYGRYSDDILLCHSDLDTLNQAFNMLEQGLSQLKLRLNQMKTNKIYFSPAGNLGIDQTWKGKNKLTLLGFQLHAKGLYSLSNALQKKFLRETKSRLKATNALIERSATFSERGMILTEVVNNIILHPNLRQNFSQRIIKDCNDHSQLKHLDYLIALFIAELVSNKRGVRAFKKVSYRKIRNEWKLISLVKLRNKNQFSAIDTI